MSPAKSWTQSIQRYAELGFIHYGWTLVDYLIWATASRRKPFNEVLVYGGQKGTWSARKTFTERLTKTIDSSAVVGEAGDSGSLRRAFKLARRKGRAPIFALDLTQLPSSSMPLIARSVYRLRPQVANLVISVASLEQLDSSLKGLATFMVRVWSDGRYEVKRNIWDVRPRTRKAVFAQVLIESGKVSRN